jgi:hypothetical protein
LEAFNFIISIFGPGHGDCRSNDLTHGFHHAFRVSGQDA